MRMIFMYEWLGGSKIERKRRRKTKARKTNNQSRSPLVTSCLITTDMAVGVRKF